MRIIVLLLFLVACDDTYIPTDADVDSDYEPPIVNFCCWECGVYNCCVFHNTETGSNWDYDSPLRESCSNTVSHLLDNGKVLDSSICEELDREECP